ncbi:sulfotransferase 1C4-like [Fopius arisanus]|uniref:Sulfotransferase 1C4-like n=1 Tax=Fopius arisanus TaxID=64838 RepID=A0A9R1U008_9HYME|nr:PREDICTED: sulfotransferase 1C4-like [Fopius arisanus]
MEEFEDFHELWSKLFNIEYTGRYITVKGVRLPENFSKFRDEIENFEIRDDDVWVCSFPKAGTTWTQEMVWCLGNDLDFEGAKADLFQRFPFFEIAAVLDYSAFRRKNPDDKSKKHAMTSLEFCRTRASPRFIKTHLPFHLLPRDLREGKTGAKIVYVWRNPKDTCISFFHHSKLLGGFRGDFQIFCRLFLADKLLCCPYWSHILGFWNNRDNLRAKMLWLKYEDMKSDLSSIIHKTSEFLGKSSLSPENLQVLEDHLSFTKMKNNPAVNKEEWIEYIKQFNLTTKPGKFMRSGEVNQWMTGMSPEMSQKFDDWTSNHLKSSDLTLWKYFSDELFRSSAIIDHSVVIKNFPELENHEFLRDSVKYVEHLPHKRFIKTHLPFHLLPRDLREGRTRAKIIYVCRNPKDVCISFYHHAKHFAYRGDFQQFCRLFLGDKVPYSPFWSHVSGFWEKRNDSSCNILFLKYEEMKVDLGSVIERTVEFLEKPKLSTEKLQRLLNHLSFGNMKLNPAVNHKKRFGFTRQYLGASGEAEFIRQGQINQWKAVMSREISEEFDEWISRNSQSSDLSFYFLDSLDNKQS